MSLAEQHRPSFDEPTSSWPLIRRHRVLAGGIEQLVERPPTGDHRHTRHSGNLKRWPPHRSRRVRGGIRATRRARLDVVARTGRRAGAVDTRSDILGAARRHFTANGYDGATIRGIASDAGVDPALVHHYFGAKDELFIAALDLPINPAAVIPRLLAEGVDGLGERIVSTMLRLWDATDVNPLIMVLRSLSGEERTAELM